MQIHRCSYILVPPHQSKQDGRLWQSLLYLPGSESPVPAWHAPYGAGCIQTAVEPTTGSYGGAATVSICCFWQGNRLGGTLSGSASFLLCRLGYR
jgi:hypothetical protein